MKSVFEKGAQEKLDKLVAYATERLSDLENCLYGKEDRPNDLMDCGEIDGAYEAFLDVLKLLGVDYPAAEGYGQK